MGHGIVNSPTQRAYGLKATAMISEPRTEAAPEKRAIQASFSMAGTFRRVTQ